MKRGPTDRIIHYTRYVGHICWFLEAVQNRDNAESEGFTTARSKLAHVTVREDDSFKDTLTNTSCF